MCHSVTIVIKLAFSPREIIRFRRGSVIIPVCRKTRTSIWSYRRIAVHVKSRFVYGILRDDVVAEPYPYGSTPGASKRFSPPILYLKTVYKHTFHTDIFSAPKIFALIAHVSTWSRRNHSCTLYATTTVIILWYSAWMLSFSRKSQIYESTWELRWSSRERKTRTYPRFPRYGYNGRHQWYYIAHNTWIFVFSRPRTLRCVIYKLPPATGQSLAKF